jgi:hypothetical protein
MYSLPSITYVLAVALPGKPEITLPEQLAGLRVRRTQLAVEVRGADQQHTKRGHDGVTVAQRPETYGCSWRMGERRSTLPAPRLCRAATSPSCIY